MPAESSSSPARPAISPAQAMAAQINQMTRLLAQHKPLEALHVAQKGQWVESGGLTARIEWAAFFAHCRMAGNHSRQTAFFNGLNAHEPFLRALAHQLLANRIEVGVDGAANPEIDRLRMSALRLRPEHSFLNKALFRVARSIMLSAGDRADLVQELAELCPPDFSQSIDSRGLLRDWSSFFPFGGNLRVSEIRAARKNALLAIQKAGWVSSDEFLDMVDECVSHKRDHLSTSVAADILLDFARPEDAPTARWRGIAKKACARADQSLCDSRAAVAQRLEALVDAASIARETQRGAARAGQTPRGAAAAEATHAPPARTRSARSL